MKWLENPVQSPPSSLGVQGPGEQVMVPTPELYVNTQGPPFKGKYESIVWLHVAGWGYAAAPPFKEDLLSCSRECR